MSSRVYKHVFLEYAEYERLLSAKKKNEELLNKVRILQEKVVELETKGRNQHGSGLDKSSSNLSRLFAEKNDQDDLKVPLPGVLNSITFPPSAKLDAQNDSKWYYLGIPEDKDESQRN